MQINKARLPTKRAMTGGYALTPSVEEGKELNREEPFI